MRLYSLQMERNSLQLHDYYSKFIIYGKVKTEFVWIKDFLLFCERIFIYTKGKSEILRARFNCTVKSRPYNRLSIPILLSTQTVLYYYFYMYRGFAVIKFFCSRPHGCMVFDNEIGKLYAAFIHIICHQPRSSSAYLVNGMRGWGRL